MVTDGNVIGAGREVLLSAGLNVLSSPVQNPSITNTRENTNADVVCGECDLLT